MTRTTTATSTCHTCKARAGHTALDGLCDFCNEVRKMSIVLEDVPSGGPARALLGPVSVAATLIRLAAEHADDSTRRSDVHGLMDPAAMFEAGMSQAYLHAAACLRSMLETA